MGGSNPRPDRLLISKKTQKPDNESCQAFFISIN